MATSRDPSAMCGEDVKIGGEAVPGNGSRCLALSVFTMHHVLVCLRG